MAGNRKAPGFRSFVVAAGSGGTLHYILQRPIVLDKVEVGRSNGAEWHAEVPYHGNSLQENLREQNRGAPVEIDAAWMHQLGHRAEQTKIAMRGVPESRALCRRVHVWNVGADGQVHGHRNSPLVRRRKNARFRVFCLDDTTVQKLSGRLAIANANALRQLGNFVQVLAGFFGHSEFAFAQCGLDVLGSVSCERNLEIVDERRAVHRNSRNEASIHQVNQDGSESYFDHVPAHAPQNRFALFSCGMQRAQQLPKTLGRENVRQRIQKLRQRCICCRSGLREFPHVHLAFARRQRIRAHFSENQRLDRIDAHWQLPAFMVTDKLLRNDTSSISKKSSYGEYPIGYWKNRKRKKLNQRRPREEA